MGMNAAATEAISIEDKYKRFDLDSEMKLERLDHVRDET